MTLDADVQALSQTPEPYVLVRHKSSLRSRLDSTALNRLADELEDDAIIAKSRRLPQFPQHAKAHAWWEQTLHG